MHQKAVVIIPTYNEHENISKLIPVLAGIFEKVSSWDMHILIVDDNSPDGTADVVKKLSREYPFVHLFENEKKAGLGHAYLLGMHHSFEKLNADVVFQMDADFQHDPFLLPTFLAALDAGADMVIGSRYIKGGSIPADWGVYRKFLSVVGNVINMIVLTDFSIHDWTTGYRAVRKKVFEAVQSEMDDAIFSGYTFQIGFLHKALRRKFVIKEIPLQFADRKVGQSKLGPDYIKNALKYIFYARYKEIVQSHLFKFGIVGGIGFLINAIGLEVFFRMGLDSGNAAALGAEFAIISNFILNNFWTFSERKVTTVPALLSKFVQFNLASMAAVLIQKIVVGYGTSQTSDDLKFVWFVFAVAIGMVVNYLIYSKVIWKKKEQV